MSGRRAFLLLVAICLQACVRFADAEVGHLPVDGICGKGTYLDSSTRAVCVKCPIGTYSNVEGATDSSTCQLCEKGYTSTAGAESCTPCPEGFINPNEGGECTEECPAGYTSPLGSFSLAQCLECSAGSHEVNGVCKLCPAGQYQPVKRQTTCRHCGDGYTTTPGAHGHDHCQACPAGYLEVEGECRACPVGQYQSAAGQTSCVLCPAGTRGLIEGGTSEGEACQPCESGYYSDDEGAIECKACPTTALASTATGQTTCTCPADAPQFCGNACCTEDQFCGPSGNCVANCADYTISPSVGTCSVGGDAVMFGGDITCNFPPDLGCQPGHGFNVYPACKCQDGNIPVMCNPTGQLCLALPTMSTSAAVNGDPHFTGFEGTRFDFKGTANDVYNLISHTHHVLNAEFGNVEGINGTMGGLWLTALGAKYGNTSLLVKISLDEDFVPEIWRDFESRHATHMRMKIPSDRQWLYIELNGDDYSHALYSGAISHEPDGSLVYFPDATKVNPDDGHDGPVVIFKTPELELTFYVETEDTIHLDVGSHILSNNVTEMHGILGQTINWAQGSSRSGKFIQGEDNDYLVKDGLLGTEFAFSRFKGGRFPKQKAVRLGRSLTVPLKGSGLWAGTAEPRTLVRPGL